MDMMKKLPIPCPQHPTRVTAASTFVTGVEKHGCSTLAKRRTRMQVPIEWASTQVKR